MPISEHFPKIQIFDPQSFILVLFYYFLWRSHEKMARHIEYKVIKTANFSVNIDHALKETVIKFLSRKIALSTFYKIIHHYTLIKNKILTFQAL